MTLGTRYYGASLTLAKKAKRSTGWTLRARFNDSMGTATEGRRALRPLSLVKAN